MPSSLLSSGPSSEPSRSPMGGPMSGPSSMPSSDPSAAPFSQPSAGPSSTPSSGPSVSLARCRRHGVIDGPVAEDDAADPVGKDEPVSNNLFANDSDPEGDDLTVTKIGGEEVDPSGTTTITLPSGAVMTIDGETGDFTVDPNGEFSSLKHSETATVTVQYIISDGIGGTDSATVTLTLTGNNLGPDAEDDSKTTLPCATVSEGVLVNDSDPEGDALSVRSVEDDNLTVTKIGGQDVASVPDTTVSLPLGAILTIDTNTGDFSVDPSGHFDFLDSIETAFMTFEYVISDGNGGTDAATVTLTLQGDNGAPYAEDDSKTVLPTGSVSSSMMANDSDPENDVLTVISVEGTADPSTSTGGVAVVTLPSGAMVTVSKSGEYTHDSSGHQVSALG